MDLTKSKKIVYTGLDNSGKTSLNLILRQNIVEVGLVKPTYLVDRSVFKYLDYDIIQHDLGGQRKYLISYLKEPGKFFNETDTIIFVVDIQDEERYEEAKDYYMNLLEQIGTLNLEPNIWILFHKAEKALIEADEVELASIESLKREFTRITAGKYRVSYEVTSIFDRWSTNRAFSFIFKELYPQQNQIDSVLQTLANELNNASVVAIYDENLLEIASFVRDDKEKKLIDYTVPYLYRMKKDLDENMGHHDLIELNKGGYGYIFTDLHNSPILLYLLVIGIKGQIEMSYVQVTISKNTFAIVSALGIKG